LKIHQKSSQEHVLHELEVQDGQLSEEMLLLIPEIPKGDTHFSILFDPQEGQEISFFLLRVIISSNLLWH